MYKQNRIIFIAAIFTINIIFSQNINNKNIQLSPAIKSIILPGWGQYSLDKNSRGNFYITTEILGIAITTFSFVKSNSVENTFVAMASEHAGANESGKDHQYWVDIGNYNSLEDYNDEHLRWREYDNLYPNETKWDWDWDTDDNRKEFEELRIQSDKFKLAGKFFIGGIVLNHIVSAIDAFYLKNVSLKDKVEVLSYYNPETQYLQYTLQFKL